MQSCQEQPFSLQGGRNSSRVPWGPGLGCRVESALPRWAGSRQPCETPAPRGSLPELCREAAPALPTRVRSEGSHPAGKKDAKRVGEGTAAVFPSPPGKHPDGGSVERARLQAGRSPWQTTPEWPDKLLVPDGPPFELPPPLPATLPGPGPPVAAYRRRLPSSHRAPRGRDGAGCSRLPAPAASTRGRPSGSRPGPPLSSAGPWLPAPPRRSEPRRVATWPAPARGERWTGRGGAGRGGGRELGGRAAQGPGAEAARGARQSAGSGTKAGQLRGA